MSNVLFLTEKWCDGKPDLAFTNSFQNIFNTFSQSMPQHKMHTLHMDESQVTFGVHIDKILLNYCSSWKIDIIFFSLIGGSPMNPSWDCIRSLKKLGIVTCFIWHDTGPSWGLETINSLEGLADLHISWDYPTSNYHSSIPLRNNHLKLWTPEDRTLFYDPGTKSIPVSFLGSLNGYYDRLEFLNEISEKSKIRVSGGQRQAKLSPHQYAFIVRHSSIGINFSLSQTGVFHQAKGRIFEYTASRSLLLESKNESIKAFFSPGIDYVEFDSPNDLSEKIKYYLSNDDERIKIANHGYETYNKNWTSHQYWIEIFKRIKESTNP